jgi:hypothetical protein
MRNKLVVNNVAQKIAQMILPRFSFRVMVPHSACSGTFAAVLVDGIGASKTKMTERSLFPFSCYREMGNHAERNTILRVTIFH